MSGKLTPEEVLNSVTEGINAGDLDSLMTLYEPLACFASQPGQLTKSQDGIRESLRNFIGMKGKLDLKVKRVLQANDLTLLITEWTINGTEPDGKPINLTGRGTVVLRRQSDGVWLIVIENPWGTDNLQV